MIEQLIASAGLGFTLGYLAARRNLETPAAAPMRLVRNEMLAEPMVIGPEPVDPFARAESWRMALGQFVTFAAPLNFSRAQVLGAGICSRPAYDKFMYLLRKCGAVVTYAKSGSCWGAGWDRRKFQALLRRGLVQPPFPLDLDAPRVLHTRTLESQRAQPSKSAQPAPSRALVVWAHTVSG